MHFSKKSNSGVFGLFENKCVLFMKKVKDTNTYSRKE